MKEAKRALVPSGGSIKGAFQAGALKAVFSTGYQPDIITGISVGTVNAAYIANEMGKQKLAGFLDMTKIGEDLYNYWIENITGPKSIAKKRKTIKLIYQIARNKFKGFTDSKPIDDLIMRTVSMENIRASGVHLAVGAVNIADAEIIYATPSTPNFMEYVLASKAIPLIMPPQDIGGQEWMDGGIRDSAPLKTAIRAGATEIIVGPCHSEKIAGKALNTGSLLQLSNRLMDIHINETVTNDLETAMECNHFLPPDGSSKPEEPFKGKRNIKITIIRPEREVLLDLESFTASELKETMDIGVATARKVLQENLIT